MNGGRLFLQASLLLTCYLAAAVRPEGVTGRQLSVVSRANAYTEGGVATAYSKASATVIEETKKSIAYSVSKAVMAIKEGGNAHAVIDSTAYAIARAVAEAHASTVARVNVEGDGKACATAEAEAEATAEAWAFAVAGAIIKVTQGSEIRAEVNALASSLTYGTARAWAVAMSRACSLGGFALSEQEAFARAIVRAYADVLAHGLAHVTPDSADTAAKAVVDHDASKDQIATTKSNTETSGENAHATGNADAFAKATLCEGRSAICCVPFFSARSTCRCGPSCNFYQIARGVWHPMEKDPSDDSGDCTC